MAPPGLTALGAKGSACDRLRLTGRLRAPPSGGMKHRCAGEVGALSGAIFYAAFGGENHTTALRAGENPPLVAGATTFPRKRGHYKAPLCCELLMKGLLFRALFFPLNRGKSGEAG